MVIQLSENLIEKATRMAYLVNSHSDIDYEPHINSDDLLLPDSEAEERLKDMKLDLKCYTRDHQENPDNTVLIEVYRMIEFTERMDQESMEDFWTGLYEGNSEELISQSYQEARALEEEI